MVDEPERARARSTASLQGVYAAMGVTTNPIAASRPRSSLLGHRVGGVRLPLVEADETERAQIRGALERHGLLEPAAR